MKLDSLTREELINALWQLFVPEGVKSVEVTFQQPSVILVRVQMDSPIEPQDNIVKLLKLGRHGHHELTPPSLAEILRRTRTEDNQDDE